MDASIGSRILFFNPWVYGEDHITVVSYIRAASSLGNAVYRVLYPVLLLALWVSAVLGALRLNERTWPEGPGLQGHYRRMFD